MRLSIILSLLIALSLSTTLYARPNPLTTRIRLPTDRPNPNHIYNCESWRLAAEVNNARNWKVVPYECINHIGAYMIINQNGIEPQYESDISVVVDEALKYLSTVTPTPDKNDTWLFDLTNTLISDIPYYNRSDVLFGGVPYNRDKYHAYLAEGNMPKVPYIEELYWAAKDKGFKIVILSGTTENLRSVMESNLKKAGFDDWDKLILKDKPKMPTKDFKASTRAQLKKEGYKVIGNVGDQWTDLLTGGNAGKRTFKMPNPMYYVS